MTKLYKSQNLNTSKYLTFHKGTKCNKLLVYVTYIKLISMHLNGIFYTCGTFTPSHSLYARGCLSMDLFFMSLKRRKAKQTAKAKRTMTAARTMRVATLTKVNCSTKANSSSSDSVSEWCLESPSDFVRKWCLKWRL